MFAMLLLPACTNRSLSKENDKLRAQRQDLQQQIASLQEKITLREGELKAVRQQLSEGATPITGVQTPRLAGIVLGLYTGPIDLDGDAKFDALRVYVRPVDQHGRQITAEGTAKITLVSLPADGSAVGTVLLEKTFDTDAFHQSYRSGVTGTPVAPMAPSISVLAQAARCGTRPSTMAGACLAGVVWKACAPISMPM